MSRHYIPRPRRAVLAACLGLLAAPETLAGRHHEEVLGNGLRAILVEHHANPMVASAVVVDAGVVHEPEGLNGASHLLEHLLFNGTETRTQRQLYDEVDRYGAYNNATTREDHTLFTLLIQKEFAERGLEIQADMLFHSTLPAENFEKEKGIVLEELARDRTDPGYLAELAHRRFAFAGTPMARSVLGTEESIRGTGREAVLSYYRARYVPANMTLVLMGDFDTSTMLPAVRRIFGAAPGGAGTAAAAAARPWPPRPERNLLRSPLDAPRHYLFASLPLPAPLHDPRMAAVEILLAALAEGADAPLDRELTTGAEPLVLSFSLGLAPRAAAWSSVELEATLADGGRSAAVLDRFQAALRGLVPGSAAWDRIDAVRAAARAEEALLADKIHYYALTLSSWIPEAPPGYLEGRLAALDRLDDEDFEAAAAMLRTALPAARVVQAGPGLEERQEEWKAESTALAAPAPASRRVSETLPSGLEVVFERNDDSRVFGLHVMLRPRSASEPAGKEGIADFLHRALLRGSLVRDAAAVDAALAALGAEVRAHDDAAIPYDDYQTTPRFSFLRLEMPSDRWREGLALLAEVVAYPRLAPDDVEAIRAEMLDLQARAAASPRAVAESLLSRALAPGHPEARSVLGTAQSVGSITREDLVAFHREYVTGKRLILTGVGPVSPEAFLEATRSVFGAVAAGSDPPEPAPPPITAPGLTAGSELGKGQAQLALGYLFDADPADRAALTVAAAVLSDRLAFDLREERGLAYSIGAAIRPWAGRSRFEVLMGTRPENLDAALEGIRSGIAAFREAAIDEETVRRAANALRGRAIMRRMSRVGLAYFAGIERLEGRPPGDDLRALDALRTVTAADLKRVVARYLDPGRLAVVTVR